MLSRYNAFDYKLDTRLNVGFIVSKEFWFNVFSKIIAQISLQTIPSLGIFSQLLTKMMFGGETKYFANAPKNVVYEMLKEKKNKIQDKVLEDNIETDDNVGTDELNTNQHVILFSLNNYKKNGVKNGY